MVSANFDLEAAETVAHREGLRRAGKLGELHVRVQAVDKSATEVRFYSNPPHYI
jgi:hypothetical protein